jgi:hypothetical protein
MPRHTRKYFLIFIRDKMSIVFFLQFPFNLNKLTQAICKYKLIFILNLLAKTQCHFL